MESAEQKTKKRVRHLFPRKEIYHRFVHSDEYAYTPNKGIRCSCIGNYLVGGIIPKHNTIQDFEEMWYSNSTRMIAIIDRINKRILINTSFVDHAWELEKAVPNNFDIYYTRHIIPNKDILSNLEELYKIHSKELIERWVNYHLYYYFTLNGINRNLNYDIDANKQAYYFKKLEKFVKDKCITRYKFYKECLDSNYNISIWKGYNRIKLNIKLPSLKQIVTNTVFNKKETLFLRQKYFWTRYCYCNNIPFKDVVKYWNKPICTNDAITYLEKRLASINENWFTTETIWNEFVIKAISTIRKIDEKIVQDNIDKSTKNRLKAIEELNNSVNTIDAWRNFKTNTNVKIKYNRYIPPRNNRECGEWKEDYVYRSNTFSNIQLRLDKTKTIIQTSNNAQVSLESGIAMYKLFNKLIQSKPKEILFTSNDFGNVNVGIYNLRFIAYRDKIDKNKNNLNRKEWVIQIGCHDLWLDDINEFIHYYKLEDKFGLTK